MTEDRRQTTEDRRQKTEDREWVSGVRCQVSAQLLAAEQQV
ncbi:hypothetical protein D1AOALGA4SA_12390 [Olavius algarvensis Delta 1 endosymbiont]|nr:hypothetical protein D1AOALGA4SA_12390 [Olavius algarvensis Delta 1 endosymbiont]